MAGIPNVMGEREAADMLRAKGYPISVDELRTARANGEITYWQRCPRGKVRYTEQDLEDFVKRGIKKECQNNGNSKDTGSTKSAAPRTGTDIGTTRAASGEQLLTLQTLKKLRIAS